MSPKNLLRSLLCLLVLTAAACDDEKETQASVSHTPKSATPTKPTTRSRPDAAAVRFTTSVALNQAFAEAKQLNKPVFVLFSTDFCTPCKLMEEYVFTVPDLANYLNSSFVNYKFDCMNFEADVFTKKYGVKAYPTLTFMRPDGTVISSHVGSLNYTEMRLMAQNALAKYRDNK